MTNLRFGLFLPQNGQDATAVRDVATAAERNGFESVWVFDHLFNYPTPRTPAVLEAFTLLSLVAGWTETIRLGTLVLVDGYRPPALTAKMAATLDALSGGRFELGYGSGWLESEYRAYGYDFPKASTRVAMMEEALVLMKEMWKGEPATFRGAHYHVEGALCLPRPQQRPHPPITVGGGGEKVLLRAVARHADTWNYFTSPLPEYEHKRDVLHEHCRALGRDPASMGQSLLVPLVSAEREKEVRDRLEAARQLGGTWAYDGVVQGTPDIVVPRLLDYARRGVTQFIFALPDPTEIAQIEYVGRAIAAQL